MGVIFQKFGKDYDNSLLGSIENYMYDNEIDAIEDIDIDDMRDYVFENFITYEEVITYYEAWSYIGDGLRLNEALNIANEYGYDIKSLNVELLATILRQEDLQEELEKFISEI